MRIPIFKPGDKTHHIALWIKARVSLSSSWCPCWEIVARCDSTRYKLWYRRHDVLMTSLLWYMFGWGQTFLIQEAICCSCVRFIACLFCHWDPGPCLTTAIWRCRKNSSQWQRSFQWKLHSHWLEFLLQRHVAVVRQGPVLYVHVLSMTKSA